MARSIIFCADGTWNHPDETDGGLPADTNVYKIYKAFSTNAGQIAIYDDGVGSDGTLFERLEGGAIGEGLIGKVKDGYQKIAHTWELGDAVHLFGFSRGAFTARSLGGLLALLGLPDPTKDIDAASTEVIEIYKQEAAERVTSVPAWKAKWNATPVTIATIGVWDTVGALGIPLGVFDGLNEDLYGFLDTALHPDVKAAYHALSIDERRPEFAPTLWTSTPVQGQILEQVWFAGVHSDVGGGYAEQGLSDIALRWMVLKAAGRGLAIDPNMLAFAQDVDAKYALATKHESWNILWGFPKTRAIPQIPGSAIANTVTIRIDDDLTYQPKNVAAVAGVIGAAPVV